MPAIYNPKAELSILRGLCSKDKLVVGTIMAGMDSSYLQSEEAIEIYDSIHQFMTKNGEPPAFRTICTDPKISREARTFFKEAIPDIKDKSDAVSALELLDSFRILKGLDTISRDINEQLQRTKVDPKKLLERSTESVRRLMATKSNEQDFLHFGMNNNSSSAIKSLLNDNMDEDVIPTGITDFDENSGGLIRGSLLVVGGNSGAGKSHVAIALGKNIASFGHKVTMLPLEMSNRETSSRLMANITKIDSLKFTLGKLSEGEKSLAWRKYARWVKNIKKIGGRFSIFKPKSDITIEEVFASLSTFKSDVVIIDYVGLLKGATGDEQWKRLGEIARLAKINAELNNSVNILLAQVDDDGRIKYSSAIKEHASNAWIFTANEDTKEQGILPVQQIKSRNQQGFPFTLEIDYRTSTVQSIKSDFGPSANAAATDDLPNIDD